MFRAVLLADQPAVVTGEGTGIHAGSAAVVAYDGQVERTEELNERIGEWHRAQTQRWDTPECGGRGQAEGQEIVDATPAAFGRVGILVINSSGSMAVWRAGLAKDNGHQLPLTLGSSRQGLVAGLLHHWTRGKVMIFPSTSIRAHAFL